jgi:hypothetical protein
MTFNSRVLRVRVDRLVTAYKALSRIRIYDKSDSDIIYTAQAGLVKELTDIQRLVVYENKKVIRKTRSLYKHELGYFARKLTLEQHERAIEEVSLTLYSFFQDIMLKYHKCNDCSTVSLVSEISCFICGHKEFTIMSNEAGANLINLQHQSSLSALFG